MLEMFDAGYAAPMAKGGVAALVLAVIARYAMQRLSRDWVDRHRDRAEVELVETLRNENKELRDRADRFAAERNDAIQKLGALTARADYLQERVAELKSEIDQLRTEAVERETKAEADTARRHASELEAAGKEALDRGAPA